MEPDPTHRGADGSMAHPSLLRQSVVQTDTQPPRTLLVLEQSLQMWDQQGKGLQFCGGISVTESGEAPRTAPVGTSVRGGARWACPTCGRTSDVSTPSRRTASPSCGVHQEWDEEWEDMHELMRSDLRLPS